MKKALRVWSLLQNILYSKQFLNRMMTMYSGELASWCIFARGGVLAMVVSEFQSGLYKIENWLQPHQNWLQSAFLIMRQKNRIDTHFHLFIYIILLTDPV